MGALTAKTRVQIMGRTYTLRGDVDPDYMMSLAAYVDSKLIELRDFTPQADPLRLALLVALNIADDYMQLKNGMVAGSSDSELARKTQELISLLDRGLVGQIPSR